MKKILSIFMTAVMLAGMFMVPTSAATTTTATEVRGNSTFKMKSISVSDGDWTYYFNNGEIRKVNSKGKNDTLVFKADYRITSLSIYKGYIYYLEATNQYQVFNICRVKTDGTGKKTLVKKVECVRENLQIVDGFIYYYDYDEKSEVDILYRMKIDGSGKKTLLKSQSWRLDKQYTTYDPTVLFVSDGLMIISKTSYNNEKGYREEFIYKCNTDGKKLIALDLSNNDKVIGIDDGYIYFQYRDNDTNKDVIKRMSLADGKIDGKWSYTDTRIDYVTILNGKIYYSYLIPYETDKWCIKRVDLNGKNKKTLYKYKTPDSKSFLEVSGNWIFFDDGGGSFIRMDLNGKNQVGDGSDSMGGY